MKRKLSVLLAIAVAAAMMPLWAFAETEQPAVVTEEAAAEAAGGQQEYGVETEVSDIVISEDQAQDPADPADPEDPAVPEDPDTPAPPVTARTFKWDGYTIKLKSFAVLTESPLGNSYKPKKVTVVMRKDGGRKVSWTVPGKDPKLDGYVVLRGVKGSKKYTEIGTKAAGKTAFVDKEVSSKDAAAYKYIVAAYKVKGDAVRITHCCKADFRRIYQNPAQYVQIADRISKHGLSYYTSPVLTDASCTRKDHIEAMIKTACKYKGDRYVVCQSDKPGKGLDCSGLVMQACYGAGVDLWPVNPSRHRQPAYEYESRNIAKMDTLKTVPFGSRQRGDLIFFSNSKGVVIHVAIYLGGDRIIHSTSVGMRVIVSGMGAGLYGRPCKVKRIFN